MLTYEHKDQHRKYMIFNQICKEFSYIINFFFFFFLTVVVNFNEKRFQKLTAISARHTRRVQTQIKSIAFKIQ